MAVTRPSRHRRASRSSNTRLDVLEARTLLSAVINYSNLSTLSQGGFGAGVGSTIDGQGNLWVANTSNDDADGDTTIDKITKNADGSLTDTYFEAPFGANTIAYNAATNSIDVAGFKDSHVTEFDLNGNPTNLWNVSLLAGASESPRDGVAQMTTTPDGAVWITSTGGAPDGVDTVTSVIRLGHDGSVSFASLPLNTRTTAISASSSDSLWVSSSPDFGSAATKPAGSLVQISWDGSNITATPFAIPQGVEVIGGAVAAPDGSVYYGTANTNAPGLNLAPEADQIDHAAVVGGQLTILKEYDIPKVQGELPVSPAYLNFGPDGSIWFAEQVPSGTGGISSLDPVSGDFTRNKFNDSNLNPVTLAVSPTDVWTTFEFNSDPSIAQDIAYIDLANSSAIVATDPALAATVNQPDTDNIAAFASSDAGNFSYTIDYGNGTTFSSTITNDGSGLFYIPANITYTAAGNFPLTVTIASANGDVATVHGTAVVTNAVTTIPLAAQGVPAISGQKDVALAPNVSGQATLVVAQFTDAPGSYTATINWGDSTSSTGAIVSLGNNQYAVELPAGQTKTYHALGAFTISVTISDGTQSVVANTTANISAVPVVASQNLVLKPLLGPIVLGSVATFTADPLSTANWFKATIHWGDGSTSTGLVVRDSSGHFEVIGLHLYTKKGTYTVTTNITDSVDSETALATATIKVTSIL